MQTPLWFWIAFNVGVLVILGIDLGILKHKHHQVSIREAAWRTAGFVGISLVFALIVTLAKGSTKGLEFLTGYLIEYSLSVDNIFVFVVLFSYFAVPAAHQQRVLFWGILTALVLRGAMIGLGVALISRFAWILYIFGAFLLVTGFKLLLNKGGELKPDANPVVRFCRRRFPMTPDFVGSKLFVRQAGKWMTTPLFLVFVVINITDVIFAVDSIPAIFGVTTDPFIVYTSNICAILGLRSLYFLLAGVMGLFHYLQAGLALVLMFIGAKMLLAHFIHISTPTSLLVVVTVLATSIVLSLVLRQGKPS